MRLFLATFAAAFFFATAAVAPAAQTSPAPILQWFEASWNTIEHRTPDLFEAGYGSLWTPPPGRSIYLPQGGGVGYDPYDRFDLGAARDETLYGTRAGYEAAIRATQQFGGNVYVDYVHHHLGSFDLNLNGYTYPQVLINQGAPYLQDRADYPGFELSDPNNEVGAPAHRDTYADLYSANAGLRPFGDVFEYWFRLGENLVTVDLASNREFVRHPVPGNPLNTREAPTAWAIPTTAILPNGRVGASTILRRANVPTAANRQFYPDLDGPSRTVVDGGVSYTVYDFNLSDPTAGDPVAETPRGYMMRYAQWLTQVIGVDGLRVDAARHVPLGDFNSTYNPESLDVPKLIDRAVAGASSRHYLDGTQRDVFQFQEVFNYDPNFLASFIRKEQPAGDTVNPNRDVLDFSLWAAMASNMSGNGFQNNWFNIRSASVNAVRNGTTDPNIANNGQSGMGFVYNHDEEVSPPGLGSSIVLDNVAHAWVLMRPGDAYVYYRSDEFDRGDNNLFFLKNGRGDALGGTFGDILTTLVDARNSYGRGDFQERFIDNAFSSDPNRQSKVYVFERGGSALVGLHVDFGAGAETRNVRTDFQSGQWLEEVTGNWQDPSGQVRRYTQVGSDPFNSVDVDIPRNNAANGNKGYTIYGLPRPRGTLSVSNVSQVLDETPTPATNGTARIADVSVVTADAFDVTLATDAVVLDLGGGQTYRDTFADGDRALLRINEGHDANGNGAADHPSSAASNDTRYGFEEFLTVNNPGAASATGDGLYVQTVDATQLAEGYHYLTARAWREARPGESEVFTDFRETIYIDRLAPESALESVAQFGPSDTTQDFQVRSLDQTADRVHVLLNLGAGLTDAEVLALVAPSNQAERIDRDLFALVDDVTSGNHAATVVTYEITGNFSVERVAGLAIATNDGLGPGDLDADNDFDLLDVNLFGGFLDDDSVFSAAADANGDGVVRIDDLFLTGVLAESGGADALTVSAWQSLFAAEVTPGDYDLDGDVDQDDYTTWVSQHNATGFASADGNADGVVDAADY
ncbi:MAG: hypothetical protein AAF805_07290, partial [Planctomycetota bacterium]